MQIGLPSTTALPPLPSRSNLPHFSVPGSNNTDQTADSVPPVVLDINITEQVEFASHDLEEEPFWMSVEGFIAAMQEQNLEYDLNGSGEVNVDDLVELLHLIARNENAEQPPLTAAQQSAPPSDASPQIINPDTRTEISELPKTTSLSSHPGGSISRAEPEALEPTIRPFPGAEIESPKAKLAELAERMMNKLTAAGFTHKPPAHLGKILNNLNLPANQQEFLLDRINELYQARADKTAQVEGSRISTLLLSHLENAGFTQRPPANLRSFVSELPLPGAVQQSLLSNLSQHFPQGLGVNFLR